MPSSGIEQVRCDDILRFEEFLRIVEAASALGVRKVRITGGEPLVRKGVIEFIRQVSQVSGIEEVTLTTNGLLLPGQVSALRDAGVQRLNVSLDSLNEDTYRQITRGGDLHRVRQGLAEAEALGLKIKLNMVVMRGINDHEIVSFASLGLQRPWSMRFIEYMPTACDPQWQDKIVSSHETLERLREQFDLHALPGNRLSGPAKPYRIAGAPGTIGIISPMSEHFCGSCNRLRVTSTGFAKSCLLNDELVDLKPALRQNDSAQLQSTLTDVIKTKPLQHRLGKDVDPSAAFSMASIGG
ncbi:MAG: GTP 3',8-cyclase MoaA [Desulfuromonas sp.]|nr:MAG: GTP 3',8-cyclase MoaA [Desulfuromonas sp.]